MLQRLLIVLPPRKMGTLSMWANVLLLFSFWMLEVSALIDQAALMESLHSSKAPQKRIVNGEAVSKGKYPFLALTYGIDLCGASLIHPDILVTAGHCAEFFREGALLGGVDIYGKDGDFHEVDTVYMHEDYVGSGAHPHDIALVKLSERSSITPVLMAGLPETPTESTRVKVIGYGALLENGPVSEYAMEADLNVAHFHFCDLLFGNLIEEVMFCTQSPPGLGTDSCQGDSGGPLLNDDGVLVGLVFFGSGCAVPNIPSVNTRISGYAEWIHDGICDLSDEKPDSCFATKSPTHQPTVRPVPSPISFAPVTKPPTTVRPVPSPVTSTPSTLIPTPLLASLDINDLDVPSFTPQLNDIPSSTDLPPVVQTIYLTPDASIPENVEFTVESEPFYTDVIPHNLPPEQLEDQQFPEREDGTEGLPVEAQEEAVEDPVSQTNDIEAAAAATTSSSTILYTGPFSVVLASCLVVLLAL